MTALGAHFYQYGLRCDHPGCQASLWRVAASEQMAYTTAQADARSLGWSVARDRLYASSEGLARLLARDYCPEHGGGR